MNLSEPLTRYQPEMVSVETHTVADAKFTLGEVEKLLQSILDEDPKISLRLGIEIGTCAQKVQQMIRRIPDVL